MAKAEKKPAVDWAQVEKEILAGILTDRQIGDKHGRSHGAIQQFAKRHKIQRNLDERIRQRTQTKLARADLAKQTSQENPPFEKASERQTVEFAAEVHATIVLKQRGRIDRQLALAQSMLDELESQTIDRALYAQLGELMASPDKNGLDKLGELYRKSMTTHQRIDAHKKAVEIEKALIALQRQAFNIGDAPPPVEPLTLEHTDEGFVIVQQAFEKRLAKTA